MRRRVEPKVSDLERDRPLAGAAPYESPQAREELRERERLREVVVRARVEPGDAILDAVARGQHQHRRPDALLANPPADLDPVEPGQHQVEDDRVVLGRGRHPHRVVAGPRDVDGVALLDEASPQEGRHLELVLDDQDAHAPLIVAPKMRVA